MMDRDTMKRWAWTAAATLAGIGLVSRLLPLANAGGRLTRQFPTEDGYLMLTMARNIGLGHGMSIADGTIPTNGTQPLATYVYAIGFWLFDGDREAGVAMAHLFQTLFALLGLFLLYRLGSRLWADRPAGREMAALAASLWFAAPIAVEHSMNGLESGLYALCVIALMNAIVSLSPADGAPKLRAWAGIGALLGLCFWARNDGVLLCAAVGLPYLAAWLPNATRDLSHRIAELAVAAVCTVAVAAPWLANNYFNFGSIVPVSGHAESHETAFALNLMRVPAKLFEHFALVLPLPGTMELETPVIVGATAILLAVVAGLVVAARQGNEVLRGLVAVGLLYGIALSLFYGLTFGAGHFMSRYLFPVSALLALALVGFVTAALTRLPEQGRSAFGAVAVAVAVLLVAGLNVRIYDRGTYHGHFQVVDWVHSNVPDDVWVGAIQTGTLGFFHDRTINLDGKVNPHALVARQNREIPAYVDRSSIMYLVDWAGIAGWIDLQPLAASFEVLVRDEERNLGVLGRRERPLGG